MLQKIYKHQMHLTEGGSWCPSGHIKS